MSAPYQLRRQRLRDRLAGQLPDRLDALLVTSLVNVRYLTGFVGSNAGLLVPTDPSRPVVMATDGRYAEAAALSVPDVEIVLERDTGPGLAALAPRRAAAGLREPPGHRRGPPGHYRGGP